jgi:uncharacterized protein YbjT (DUF2867 family)
MKIRAIVTGATGMVGEGVLIDCLAHPDVEAVLVLGRRSCGYSHPKLKEVLHPDLYDISAIADQLRGYNACYFALGVSSVDMKEPEYTKVTYTLTLGVAKILADLNPDMTFCYVSGAGTDSTEKGRSMWARVKGKTENDLSKLPFRQAFNFRPGFIKPNEGQKFTNKAYKWVNWLYGIVRGIGFATTQHEISLAMIHVTQKGYDTKILEVRDIIAAAKRE